ncbi:MAG: porin family protein [Treponema sp.]|nr:porin family protein [Treponema sp.]
MNKKFVIIFLLVLITMPIYAEHEVSLRLAPSFEIPVGIENFNSGMGAAISLDWSFFQFANNFSLGLSAGGSFTSLPYATGEPFTLIGGKVGPFLRYRPLDRLAFRAAANAGVYQYMRGELNETNLMFSGLLGAEFYLSPYFSLYADGEYTNRIFSREQPLNTFGINVGVRVNLSEIMTGRSRVQVEKTQQYRVFPVSWAWYEHNPVAAVTITNEEPNAITDINLSFFMDSYMSQPFTFANIPHIAAGESIEVPVTALFNEAMMNLTETVAANGTVRVQYRSLGARIETVSPIQMPIFHRNTLSWDDNRRAAAFVSPKDSAARFFTHYAAGAINSEQLTVSSGIPENVIYAAALFEALRLYGITYVTVPATAFANVSSDESVLDNVSYPYQALYYRGGDCSYLSILFCSMLEALNIESAFITIPGHLYLAFEIGDDTWQPNNIDIIELNGKRWLPVEITVPGQGFTRAWRIGARQWRDNLNNEQKESSTLYPIREAWQVYPSVTVPSSGDHLPIMPEWDAIIRAVTNELRAIGR